MFVHDGTYVWTKKMGQNKQKMQHIKLLNNINIKRNNWLGNEQELNK